MALKATIFKAELQIADMDRNYYHTHALTVARHPSETDERMMARILVFALHASETLEFTKGLSTEDEPDLWQKNLSGEITLWVELGQPDVKRIRKACGRAAQVYVYTYTQRSADIWWRQIEADVKRFDNLNVISLPEEGIRSLAGLAQRGMQLQCTVQEGQVWLGDSANVVSLSLAHWKQAGSGI